MYVITSILVLGSYDFTRFQRSALSFDEFIQWSIIFKKLYLYFLNCVRGCFINQSVIMMQSTKNIWLTLSERIYCLRDENILNTSYKILDDPF